MATRLVRSGLLATFIALAIIACSDIAGPRTPSAPTGLTVAVTGTSIAVEWAHDGDGVDEFQVWRRPAPAVGSFAKIMTVAPALRGFTDFELAPGGYEYRVIACRREACSDFSAVATGVIGRNTSNQPDDITGPQVSVFYVLPSDGVDRMLDASGTLARSVSSFRNWLVGKTGLNFRFDTHQGQLDVQFFRLSKTNAQMKLHDPAIVLEIQSQLQAAGRLAPDRIYIAYYDGGSNYACGGAAWPPSVPGQVAAMYLNGTPSGGSCLASFASSPTAFPGYWEFAMLHDLVHTLGIVSRAAPHHQDGWPAHVPEPTDLMYSGSGPWQIGTQMTIDVGGDDYFGASVPGGLPTLNGSSYVVPATVAAKAEARALVQPTAAEAAALADAVARLPLHVPFAIRR